jgi:hypothetical protein
MKTSLSDTIVDYNNKEGLYMIDGGTVIEVNTGNIIAYPYTYISTVVIDNDGITTDISGVIHLFDIYGNELQYSSNSVKFIEGFEGIVLRVYQYNGKDYYSSNYRLDCKYLLPDITLPTPQPDHVDVFIVVHPELSMVSKRYIDKGFVVYMGSYINNKLDITNVNTVDIQGANQILSNGEFVVLYDINSNHLVRINSKSYQQRYDIYGGEPNIKLRLYQLLNYSYPWYDNLYRLQFPSLDVEGDRYYNIVRYYQESLSPYKQSMVMNIYNEILQERQDLIKHLQHINRYHYPNITNDIIELARKYASEHHEYDTYSETVDKFIERLVMNEDGDKLYHMIHGC